MVLMLHHFAKKLRYFVPFIFCRQEDMDVENETSHPDMFDKLTQKSPDDASLTDWHLGFHIYLVNKTKHNLLSSNGLLLLM